MDFDRQEELESKARHWGVSRYRRRLKEAKLDEEMTRHGAVRELLSRAVSHTVVVIEAFLGDRSGYLNSTKRFVPIIREVGGDVCAYLTARQVLGSVDTSRPLHMLARGISKDVVQEARTKRYKAHAPGLFAYRMARFDTNSSAHMARSLNATMAEALCEQCRLDERTACDHLNMEDLDRWMGVDGLKLGIFLLRMFQEAHPGFLEKAEDHRVTVANGKRRVKKHTYLRLTEEASDWIASRDAFLEVMTPAYLPMVVPPRPWSPGQPGGYMFDLYQNVSLVRTSSPAHQRRLDEADMPVVYEALNRVQETPWRINQRVLAVIREAVERGGGIAGIPSTEPVPEPEKPARLEAEDFDASNPGDLKVLREYKRAYARAKSLEFHRHQEVRGSLLFHTVVREIENEKAIWFPHNLDFRGRLYPIPTALSPQGDDLSKGVLEFADGKRVGKRGIFWLAVHLANTLGDTPTGQKVSRMTLEERETWTWANKERIAATAADPWSDLWWTEADDPFQFLAACIAWMGVMFAGEDYVCHLPVAVDGACNGLQHFAGMLRDEEGAKAVNVYPNERPRDVYSDVTDKVRDILVTEAGENPLARRWLRSGVVKRKLCKRPTMTFGYGSKPFGMSAQLREYVQTDVPNWAAVEQEYFMQVPDDDPDGIPYPVTKQATAYLAGVIWRALEETVQGAFGAMAWMQEVSRIVAKGGRPVEWTVAETNFPVMQAGWKYYKRDRKRVLTHLYGGVPYRPLHQPVKENQPDTRKQANGVSPNFVHSLDAAALQLAVTMANHDGVEHFAMVHDSFGTHPSDMDVLLRATRQGFFHLYSRNDVIEEFYHELLNQTDDIETMDPPPELGDLDVSGVLVSDYFFA